jgi:hypothetical protein
MRRAVPAAGRLVHACPAHAVVLLRSPHIPKIDRQRRPSRIRLRPVRTSLAVRRRDRSVCAVVDLRQEGAISVRPVRPSRPPRGRPPRTFGVRLSLRTHLPEVSERRLTRHPSGDLRGQRAPHPVRDDQGRLRGIRLPRLRPSILLRRTRPPPHWGTRPAGFSVGRAGARDGNLSRAKTEYRAGASKFFGCPSRNHPPTTS